MQGDSLSKCLTTYTGLAFPISLCYDQPLRTYVGRVEHTRLRRFLPEDVLPSGLLQELVLGWFSRSTTTVWAVVAENNAEAIRREVRAGCHRDACGLLGTVRSSRNRF